MKLHMMAHGQEAAHNMEVLSQKYPGIMIICQGCGAVLANIQRSDIYLKLFISLPPSLTRY